MHQEEARPPEPATKLTTTQLRLHYHQPPTWPPTGCCSDPIPGPPPSPSPLYANKIEEDDKKNWLQYHNCKANTDRIHNKMAAMSVGHSRLLAGHKL